MSHDEAEADQLASAHLNGPHPLIVARDEIELLLLAAERPKINELYRSGRLKDEARRRIERELDVREAHLANQRTEE